MIWFLIGLAVFCVALFFPCRCASCVAYREMQARKKRARIYGVM